MYYYVTAHAVSKVAQSKWQSGLDLSNTQLKDIFAMYRKVYLELGNDFITGNVFFDLENIRTTHSTSYLKVNQYLVEQGNNTLATIDTLPSFDTKYALYSDAFRAGYKVDLMKLGVSYDTPLPVTEKTSLRLTRPDTDMMIFNESCIVSVNGFWHNIAQDGDSIIVIDGAKSMHKSRQNQIGIYSFRQLGKITRVPITESMIYKEDTLSTLYEKTYINIGQSVDDKVAILVLGGYLVLPDRKAFYQTGAGTFALNMERLPYFDRFFEANPYIDLSNLGLSATNQNPSQVDTRQLMSDEVLKKYYTLSQSYVILLDSASFFSNRIQIRKSKLPGMFTAYKEPVYPLVVANGRVAEYWKTFEDGHWAVNVYDSYLHNRVFDATVSSKLTSVTDSSIPVETYKDSRGFLLEIGRDY